MRRRRVLTLGGLFLVAAPLLIALGTPARLWSPAWCFRSSAWPAWRSPCQLYLMDHISRARRWAASSPLRLFYAAGVWAVGPWLGVYLKDQVADWIPFALASAAALSPPLALFWYPAPARRTRRWRRPRGPAAQSTEVPGPTSSSSRACGSPGCWPSAASAWWMMFFIYAPISAVESGLDQVDGGGHRFDRLGGALHRAGCGAGSPGATVSGGCSCSPMGRAAWPPWPSRWPAACPGLWRWSLVAAAIITGAIDGAGNVPFLRAVHPMERAEMTTVFATYRDVSQLGPPGIFALLAQSLPPAGRLHRRRASACWRCHTTPATCRAACRPHL